MLSYLTNHPLFIALSRNDRWLIIAAMLVCFNLLFGGIFGDVPTLAEGDEFCYVPLSAYMAKAHSFNPHYFVNPGTTLFYPLVVYYSILDAFIFNGTLFQGLHNNYDEFLFDHMYLLCVVPRYFSVFALVFTLPFAYLAAKQIYDHRVARLLLVFLTLSPLLIEYGQIIRTDTIFLFWTSAAIYFITLVLKKPTLANNVVAGVCTGLSISTRYFGLALLPCLVLANLWAQRLGSSQVPAKTGTESPRARLLGGIAATVSTFVLMNPYFFLDFKKVVSDLQYEAFSDMIGSDNRGHLGNLFYYIGQAVPEVISAPLAAASAVGVFLLLVRRKPEQLLWLLYVLIMLLGISLNLRHWARWLIPIMPVLLMWSSDAFVTVYRTLDHMARKSQLRRTAVSVGCTLALIALLIPQWIQISNHNLRKSQRSTDKEFYTWLRANIPAHSAIAFDGGYLWGYRKTYNIQESIWRPDYMPPRRARFNTPEDLATAGYKYLVINEFLRKNYEAAPERFPVETNFYKDLSKFKVIYSCQPKPIARFIYGTVFQRGSYWTVYDLHQINK